jgi:hypothetical protein
MKLTNILNNIISEVGEGSANPYSYSVKDKLIGGGKGTSFRDVTFTTEDGDDYIINFSAYYSDEETAFFKLDFTTVDEYGFENRADEVINKGRLFRIMATIVAAAKEFLNDIDYKEKGIKKMVVFPSKSKGMEKDDRRANLYMAYIKRQLPVSDISYDGKRITATLAEEVNEKEELTFTPSSGTKAGGTFSLNNRKYELTSPIKDVTIGGRYVTTLPKGTILYNLTGGLLADHESLKKFESRSSQYFDKPNYSGIAIRQDKEVLNNIINNSKVLEFYR